MRETLLLLALIAPSSVRSADAPLTFHGKTFEQWHADLKNKDAKVRGRAATALGLGPFGGKAVVLLLQALGDKDAQVHQRAIVALGDVGPEGKAAIPFLAALIADEEEDHEAIFEALGKIGPEAAPAILDACKKYFKHSAGANSAFRRIGQAAIPLLVKGMKDDDDIALRLAMVVSQDRRGDAVAVIPKLVRVLIEDRTPEFRYHVFQNLGLTGPTAEAAVPVFMNLLDSKEYRGTAAFALANLGKPAYPALRQVFDKGSPAARLLFSTIFSRTGKVHCPCC